MHVGVYRVGQGTANQLEKLSGWKSFIIIIIIIINKNFKDAQLTNE